ncbi:MAG: hypothetical protein ABTQ30_06995 [Rhizobiaceae bacterium]
MPKKTPTLAAALFAAFSMLPAGALAQGVDLNRPGSLQLRQTAPLNELQTLQNRQNRQNFQDQQQNYRQQERDSNTRIERPAVPRMDSNCQLQIYGNSTRTVCR